MILFAGLLLVVFSYVLIKGENEETAEDGQAVVYREQLAEDYLTAWFTEQLSEHYELSNFHFDFSKHSLKSGKLEIYGYVELDHEIRYSSLDELPFVCGMAETLGIDSMEAIVDGSQDGLSVEEISSKAGLTPSTLTEAKMAYLCHCLSDCFTDVQRDMEKFNAAYFFRFKADFHGERLDNPTVEIEAEGVGYLPAEQCMPGSSEELFQKGCESAMDVVREAVSYEAEATPRGYAAYDRIAARDYALRYSSNPVQSCNDGVLAYNRNSSFPNGVNYAKWNMQEYPYFSMFCHNDCANFVSQAMSAGGLPENGKWFRTKNVQTASWSASWTSVSAMKNYMTTQGYWSPSNFAMCNAGNILLTSSGHVTMITLNDTVTHCYSGHTNDRRNVSFQNNASYQYYAIKLT